MRNRLSAVAACLVLAAYPAIARTEPTPSRAAAVAPDTSWVARSAIYEIFVRDFSPTGNFRGVIAGLDRIKAVGANVVWLMPIYPVGVANRKGSARLALLGERLPRDQSRRSAPRPTSGRWCRPCTPAG